MRSFKEVELINDGNITMYDIYSITRPDIDKYYDEITHYDARFIIKEPSGKERRLISIKGDTYAKPLHELKLSARDKEIENYINGIGPKPHKFSKAELNCHEGEIINGFNCNERINGFRVYTPLAIKNSFKPGTVIFGISGYLKDKDIKKLYNWKWKSGPTNSKEKPSETIESNIKQLERMSFCMDLWSMQAFCGFKANSSIRIADLDLMEKGEPMFRNWKRIYKDFKTQNVILELE